ncbi:Similar to smg9: Protein SMG9 (Xenopus tropicalis) [Cotesia congregata]|uniref:Similar to smg9: Protein SMG9 (Xenopus tropicalis) n=1 Tax=Cotesia congregata TaxID=51543 RepID=A0A8J2HIL0_COTCN|nr:Similar to smg9: Protein SMG9 (Xenopus tropicalis) [Cotesia congregata]
MNSRKITTVITKDYDTKDAENRPVIKVADRPTFILKTREGENRAVSPSQRNGAKKEMDASASTSTKSCEARLIMTLPQEMTSSVKLMDENMQLYENVLEELIDQQDFLVVGILGTQGPILSSSIMTSTNTTLEHYVNSEYNLEIQSLQFTAFLYSVCHVIIVVQDWFVDPNLIRQVKKKNYLFIQTAEMLKPSSTSNLDQDYIEYYPHMLFLHNKAEVDDFMPDTLKIMTGFYDKVFARSRLQTHSGLNMSSCSTDGQLNLFLIPEIKSHNEPIIHENEKELIQKLRNKIHGISRNPLTPSALTEKNWYHYAFKVVEAIKKSHLFVEYGRLLP